ncbi:MAG: outer membrane lipoprotein carrier protein LolA [Thermoanaerobaculales bacterium]|jgi:hypothetical protein|nr:outer membrane lipoprotein carrier protein LolA [Thermoanaerobaculales bacterium]
MGFGAAAELRSDEAGAQRLEALSRVLAGHQGWSAEFDQEYIPAGMTMGEPAAGRVWLAWPDRALFHTGDPPYRLMGLSGRTVRLVDSADETCDEHVLTDREWERIPLAVVLDPRGAQLHFGVDDGGDNGIILTPKEPGGVDSVEIILGDDDLPTEVVIRDPQGAVNRMRFRGWAPTAEPPGGCWLPEPPSGVPCVADQGALD